MRGCLKGWLVQLAILKPNGLVWNQRIQGQHELLSSFRVHPSYREIEQEANQLTSTIQELANANIADRRLIDLYTNSIEEEQEPDIAELA